MDDNEEFAHLEKDDFGSLVLGGHDDLDAEDDNEKDEEEEERPEVVSAATLRQQLQEAAREQVRLVLDDVLLRTED